MKYCPSLTQRLCQSCCWAAVENIMNLILQVHNSCKWAVTAPIPLCTSLLVKRSIPVACCSKPLRQRPVKKNIQHIKPERPVGLTPEPCDVVSSQLRARGWRDGRKRRHKGNSLHVWLLFGMWFIEMRFYSSTAGTVSTKWAVAVQEVATSHRGCGSYGHGGRFLVKAAVSEIRVQRISSLMRGGEQAAHRGAGQDRPRQVDTHLTHTCVGLWERNWLAAQWAGGGIFVQAWVVIVFTGMITYSNVCNLKDKTKL